MCLELALNLPKPLPLNSPREGGIGDVGMVGLGYGALDYLKKKKYFSYSGRSIIFLNFISFLTINRSSLTSNWTASSGLRSRMAFCVTWFCNYEYDAVRKASYGVMD